MKKYLMGSSSDTLGAEHGMYPVVFVDEITKDDLIRAQRDGRSGIVIINLIDGTFYSPDKNEWIELRKFDKYKDQWEQAGGGE